MTNEKSKILTAEEEMQLRKPIEDYVGRIQEKIDGLRKRILPIKERFQG